MYRVIIVDDEAWALIGIRKLLERSGNRFQIIFETTDPVKALEMICQERPDVVFTDVRMPEISGIDLMHRVRELGIATDFVVISGFAEFSYVQQALQEGAIDYQLKPLELKKAAAMLDHLYQKLENKHITEDLAFYLSLLEGREETKTLLKTRLNREPYQRYQVVTVYFKSSETDTASLEGKEPLERILQTALGEKAQFTTLKLGPKKCIFMINSEDDQSQLIFDGLMLREDVIYKAGISLSGDSADKLLLLLKNSELASNECFIDHTKRISIYRKVNKKLVNHYAEQITELLELHQFRNLKEIFSGMTNYFVINDLTIEGAVFLWNKIAMYASGSSEKDGRWMDLEFLDYVELNEKFMNLDGMSGYLYDQLSEQEPEQEGAVNQKFNEMLRFIDKHYGEDLFLNELCGQYFINISYCCGLFRKVTGVTFSRYITDLRMKKACELLYNPVLSITDVSERVGYHDYFYFSKVFKRNLGITPSEYRKSREKETQCSCLKI